jgi:hypothetical protein
MFKKLGSAYIGFITGLVFGAVVATLTSVQVFYLLGGDLDSAKTLGIHECLVEKLKDAPL